MFAVKVTFAGQLNTLYMNGLLSASVAVGIVYSWSAQQLIITSVIVESKTGRELLVKEIVKLYVLFIVASM